MQVNAQTTVNSFDEALVHDEILPKLSLPAPRNGELVFHAFRKPCQTLRQEIARRISVNENLMNLLRMAGIGSVDLNNPSAVALFLTCTVRCIKRANTTVPWELKSAVPARDLVYSCDVNKIRHLLAMGEMFSLKRRIAVELRFVKKDMLTASSQILTCSAVLLGVDAALNSVVDARLISSAFCLVLKLRPLVLPIQSNAGTSLPLAAMTASLLEMRHMVPNSEAEYSLKQKVFKYLILPVQAIMISTASYMGGSTAASATYALIVGVISTAALRIFERHIF